MPQVEREYVLAALCGALLNEMDYRPLMAAYSITEREIKRAAQVAIQDRMRGFSDCFAEDGQRTCDCRDDVLRFAALAGITSIELHGLATEVLRGALFGENVCGANCCPRTAVHVARLFLRGATVSLRDTPCFPHDGAGRAWGQETHGDDLDPEIIAWLIFWDIAATEVDDEDLPGSYRELVRVMLQCARRQR